MTQVLGARRLSAVLLAVGAIATLALAPMADAAKKPKKKVGNVEITNPANAAIPDRGPLAADPAGLLTSTITVGKQFKGRKVRDVNVTVQTTGSNAAAGGQLLAQLSAPNNATTQLFLGLTGQSLGPLTLDDESPAGLISQLPPCVIPVWLCSPYVGSAHPGQLQGNSALAVMDNGPVRGTWTLRVYDVSPMATSTLNSWRIQVVAGKPYKTK